MGEASPAAAAPATESPDTQVLSMQRQSQHPDFAISDIAKSGGVVQNYRKCVKKGTFTQNNCVNACTILNNALSLHQKIKH
jgi:hypothetical protein